MTSGVNAEANERDWLKMPMWLYNFNIQAVIIALLAFALYGNTLRNEYAFDDSISILQNQYVQRGYQGMSDLLTRDSNHSYYEQLHGQNQYTGGRYRPLSYLTFALEQQLFGPLSSDQVESVVNQEMNGVYDDQALQQVHIRHAVNVLLYMVSLIAILYLLRNIVLKDQAIIAFIAVVIFTVHPIHTEVVANIKSRDEILSLLFISLTFIFAFRYQQNHKAGQLIAALVCYFLAFLSKEYAITLLILLPLSFYLFNNYPVKKSAIATIPYAAVAALFVLLRLVIEHREGGAGMAGASGLNLAAKISTALKYLQLLIFPHPLSSDYSYNTIPNRTFADPLVWLSIIVYGAIIFGFFYFLKRRNVLAFAIAFYLGNFLIISNLFVDTGVAMGERFLYHSSLGFAIALAYLLYSAMERLLPASFGRWGLWVTVGIITLLSGFKTINRNADWKSDYTLFPHDVKVVPNSFLMNGNVAATYMSRSETDTSEQKRIEDLHKATEFYGKAISLNGSFLAGYLNRGLAYFKLKIPDSSVYDLDKVRWLNPDFPNLGEMYFNDGVLFYKNKQYQEALLTWKVAAQVKHDYVKAQKAIDYLYAAGLVPADTTETGHRP